MTPAAAIAPGRRHGDAHDHPRPLRRRSRPTPGWGEVHLSPPPRAAGSCVPRALAWRYIHDRPLAGARNMALDHALATHLGEDEAVLRLYGWGRPTVSLGRNEPANGLYRTSPDAPAVDFVRRPTGGRAVLHWRELTYAVVAPLRAWGGPRRAYLAINEALAAVLAELGVPVALARSGPSAPLRPDAGPCFRAPAKGEVVSEGRKLVGSAQARLQGALLQHGSILMEDDQGMLGQLTGGQPSEDRGLGRPTALRDLAGDVSIDEVTELVAKSLPETFGGRWSAGTYRAIELETAERLEAERYRRDSWTWRR